MDQKALLICIVYRGWRESSLLSLARVLLCLVRVGVPRVSWAVRYLDKPQWRAVIVKMTQIVKNAQIVTTSLKDKSQIITSICGRTTLQLEKLMICTQGSLWRFCNVCKGSKTKKNVSV